MTSLLRCSLVPGLLLCLCGFAGAGDDLAYLTENNPWYPHLGFPRLTTPQWVGEPGVEAVVILAIDDMRDTSKYEAYLRPILQRLKQIDGRAPVSIMTCNVKPDDPQLQSWLDEGLSIEIHTADHPCPLLNSGDLAKAKSTYDRCVDLMASIPRNAPVAFRTPCCDSLNTVSSRFFDTIFDSVTPEKRFLQSDSSVFNLFTAADSSIPRSLIIREDGSSRFRRYIPKNLKKGDAVFNTFVNTIENYPYPYLINGQCWEFPCVVPSDWEAQFLQQPDNPQTVADWKAALDITVLKQGVMCLVFHPHNWIKPEQVNELIDHAAAAHGTKVKFLTFREAQSLVNENLLKGHAARDNLGRDNGVRLVDVNRDGWMDVILANGDEQLTRVWDPAKQHWNETTFPGRFISRKSSPKLLKPNCRFALRNDGRELLLAVWDEEKGSTAFRFATDHWEEEPALQGFLRSQAAVTNPVRPIRPVASPASTPRVPYNLFFRDVDGNGASELFLTYVSGGKEKEYSTEVSTWSRETGSWKKLPVTFPAEIEQALRQSPSPLRFVTAGERGDVLVLSTEQTSARYVVDWSGSGAVTQMTGGGADADRFPPIVRKDGTDNGFFVHSGHLFWQNENTDKLPDLVDRRALAALFGDPPPDQYAMPAPLSPEASLAALATKKGLKVELVACEPLVVDPVAIDWGVDGKLWVVEMYDYPNGIADNPDQQKTADSQGVDAVPIHPGGRCKFLEDTDGDGRYDRATLFLDGLPFPTGIHCWRGGVLITAAPEIIYAEDTDGDGKADIRKTLYRGFGEGNQQHRVNGLRWGLDNWVYVGNGDSGGEIESIASVLPPPSSSSPPRPIAGSPPSGIGERVNVSGRDLRIRPDEGWMQTVTGQTQFGREQDDWGNWFGNNNSRPMFHYALDDVYLRRNPKLAVRDARVEVPEIPGASPVYPRSRTLSRFNDFARANRFTSACSTIVYRDDLLGPDVSGNSFTCEPVHNLVSRAVLAPSGATFHSHRAEDERNSEFLSSTDNWFRPVMVRTGPEGGLWVVDMYRMVIEHPKWIPDDWKAHLNLRAGDDKGRIYRIVPSQPSAASRRTTDLQLLPPAANLPKSWTELPTDRLLAMLESSNGWQRDTAQQQLVHRGELSVVPALGALVQTGTLPQTRMQALCTLDGLNQLREEIVIPALQDQHPGVRRQAVRLAERFAGRSEPVQDAVLQRTGDLDPFVRQQVAYSLGEFSSAASAASQPRIGAGLGRLLVAAPREEFLRQAVFSSVSAKNASLVLEELMRGDGPDLLPPETIADMAGTVAGFADPGGRAALLSKIATVPAGTPLTTWRLLAAARVLKASRAAATSKTPAPPEAAQLGLVEAAMLIAIDERAALERRMAALELIGSVTSATLRDPARLAGLLSLQQPAAIQTAAVRALSESASPDVPAVLLKGWDTYSPALRTQIIQACLQRGTWTLKLLDAMEQGQIKTADLDAAGRERLANHSSVEIQKRAQALLVSTIDSTRANVIERYQAAVALPADALAGQAVFEKRCAVCHQVGGLGRTVGADLMALADKSPQVLLTAIFDPNRAVEARYRSYVAVTLDGRVFAGMLTGESSNSITLVSADGKEQTLLRTELEQLRCTEKSFMPEGLEADLSLQNVADLMAFITAKSSPPKKFDGNKPAVISPNAEGVLDLPARSASIYGPTLIYEEQYRNLGYWQSLNDYAAWSLNIPRAGRYAASIYYACEDSSAGGTLSLAAGGAQTAVKVKGTGSWTNYQKVSAGELNLPAGALVLVARAQGEIPQALLDLHSVELTPLK